jgi:uncharacterized protein
MTDYTTLNRLWEAGERRCYWPACVNPRTGPASRYCEEHTRKAAEWLPGIPERPDGRMHVRSWVDRTRSTLAPAPPTPPPSAPPDGMHVRDFTSELRIREEGGRAVLEGIAVPWNVAAEIADWDGSYTESWQRGAFAKTIREGIGRIPVLVRHNRYDPSALVGRTRALTEDSVGLFCELMLGRSPEARRALEDVEDGLQDGLSIGFMPIRDKWNEKHTAVIREEARLREISLTPWPVYQETGAKVAHREESPELDRMRQVAAAMRERRPWEV